MGASGEASASGKSAASRPSQYRRVRRAVTWSGTVADTTRLEEPARDGVVTGRLQMTSLPALASVAAAVWMVVTFAFVSVPPVSKHPVTSGHRKVLPWSRLRPTMAFVFQWTQPPTPAAYDGDPAGAATTPPVPLQEPLIAPVESSSVSPAGGIDHCRGGGKKDFTAVKNVTRSVVTSAAAVE